MITSVCGKQPYVNVVILCMEEIGRELAHSPSTYWIRFCSWTTKEVCFTSKLGSLTGQLKSSSWCKIPSFRALSSQFSLPLCPMEIQPPSRQRVKTSRSQRRCLHSEGTQIFWFVSTSFYFFTSCLHTRLIRKNFILLQRLFFKWPHEKLSQCQNKWYILMISITTEI